MEQWQGRNARHLLLSYNQWRVATKHPPHLAAIIPWEGRNDYYRDSLYHGGILSQFQERWAKTQVVNVQYGRGEQGQEESEYRRIDCWGESRFQTRSWRKTVVNIYEEIKKHPLDDEWHKERTADLSQVTVPLLTCANWGGQGIHPRGNFNGFVYCRFQAEVVGSTW